MQHLIQLFAFPGLALLETASLSNLPDLTGPKFCPYPIDDPLFIESVTGYLPGQTQSKLVSCSDGKRYVLKMKSQIIGPYSSANEALGSILLRALGFPTPSFRYARIDLAAIRRHPYLTMVDGTTRRLPDVGLHFASEYIENARHGLLYDLAGQPDVPQDQRSLVLGIYLFDLWACHLDARQFLYPGHPGSGAPSISFIDNGHLFGGGYSWKRWSSPNRTEIQKALSRRYISYRDVEEWVGFFRAHAPSAISDAMSHVPPTWCAVPLVELERSLLDRLMKFEELLDDKGRR